MTGTSLEQVLHALRGQQAQAEADVQRLVEICSHSDDRAGCQAMADALLPLFAMPGLSASRHADPTGRYGDHLVFSSAAAGDAGALDAPTTAAFPVLIGHLDTVFPASVFSGYRVTEAEGRRFAHGPGVYDMKGGLVTMALALRALSGAGLLGKVPVRAVIVSDEEVGSPSSQALILKAARGASCALGFESGRAGDAIITARKGVGALTVKAAGKAGHAGNAHRESVNAIWALARFVDHAQRLTDYPRGITLNVGRIEGGTVANTVPDAAAALVDFRFNKVAEAEEITAAARAAAARAADEVPGARLTVDGGVLRLPLERTPASVALYEAYGACQREAGLGVAEAPLLGGGSDASTVAPLNIPAIDGLAPRGSGFHTLEEKMDLGTILPKAEALLRFLWTRAGLPMGEG